MSQRQQLREGGLFAVIASNLAPDVAHDAAQKRADCAQRPVGALELLGVCIALMRDQRVLANTLIGLAQIEAMLFGQAHQLFPRAMHQFGVCRKRHGFGLNRRINDDFGEVGWLGRAGARGHIQAFLNQCSDFLLAHPLPPSGDRGAVERQRMAKKLFATKQLIIGIFYPALAQGLV